MTASELAPCPFCGKTPKIVTRDVEPQGDQWYGRKCETFVLCDCGACLFDGDFHDGFYDAETRAPAAWNRRAPAEPAWWAASLNRRATVEQWMFDAARGKRPMPTADELRAWAIKLGTPADGEPAAPPPAPAAEGPRLTDEQILDLAPAYYPDTIQFARRIEAAILAATPAGDKGTDAGHAATAADRPTCGKPSGGCVMMPTFGNSGWRPATGICPACGVDCGPVAATAADRSRTGEAPGDRMTRLYAAIAQADYALWVMLEHSTLHFGDKHSNTSIARDALYELRAALAAPSSPASAPPGDAGHAAPASAEPVNGAEGQR